MKLKLFSNRKISKLSKALIAVTAIFIIASFVSPAISISTNPCSSYHGTKYFQQIDLLEANSQFPSSVQVGQTATVSVTLENLNNAPRNNLLTSVSITLQSQSNHFSVNTPTINTGSLSTGTIMATWQITGTSAGTDQFIISASAVNTHEPGLTFADTYTPNPTLTVTSNTITPTPTSQPSTTPTLTSNPTEIPTSPPSNVPTAAPTASPTSLSSSTPSSSTTPTTAATTNTPTTTPNTTEKPQSSTTLTLKPQPTQTNSASNSWMIYVHPPLAVASFVFVFIFTILVLKTGITSKKTNKGIGLTAWVLSTLGLLTGMILAQVVTGSYWSWDTKETLMLSLFSVFSVGQVAFFENKQRTAKILLFVSCILVILTASSSLILPL